MEYYFLGSESFLTIELVKRFNSVLSLDLMRFVLLHGSPLPCWIDTRFCVNFKRVEMADRLSALLYWTAAARGFLSLYSIHSSSSFSVLYYVLPIYT